MSTLLLMLLFLGICRAQEEPAYFITAIQVLTADSLNAGMTFGTVDVEIVNIEYNLCEIVSLDAPGNDFQQGTLNEFSGSNQLQECDQFPIPSKKIGKLRLKHHGTGGWTPEWIRVVFNDQSWAQCNDGENLDGGQIHDLDCA